MAVIEYDPPERFIVGTVGQPGARQFFLQVTQGRRITTVTIEKAQVAALAQRIDDLLDTVVGNEFDHAAELLIDNAPLDMPLAEDFNAATLALAWDAERDRIIVECHALDEAYNPPETLTHLLQGHEPDPDEDPTQLVLRVVISAATARAFAHRAHNVVAAGRPTCPFCGEPLNPQGHMCPRANGFKR
ncbi:Protein of uncharacterised function (DUF3090) [Dermatophilus congolensis]|uniref:Protein of uncharacterized function (DUF3090) n=1 Tax=Dermatophilus congolensis TaxID=1863 RepID=A0AA46H0E9_9MICO|nr:DUF3090 domain-containing protein [Dermatophilus congolensis]STD08875.1 Protein of uncharacterised function (DUF3090) [Dermatophilus congolensis]